MIHPLRLLFLWPMKRLEQLNPTYWELLGHRRLDGGKILRFYAAKLTESFSVELYTKMVWYYQKNVQEPEDDS